MFKGFYLYPIQEWKYLNLNSLFSYKPWWFTKEVIKISENKGQDSKNSLILYHILNFHP